MFGGFGVKSEIPEAEIRMLDEAVARRAGRQQRAPAGGAGTETTA